jgi:hypothetical protein
MQDSLIAGIINKIQSKGISYSIDKCHIIYERALE